MAMYLLSSVSLEKLSVYVQDLVRPLYSVFAMRQTLDTDLEQYRVSSENGFLPDALPLQKLPDPYYLPWEDAVHDLPERIQSGSISQTVDNLPVLSTSKLQGEPEWRRAYVILAYLTHAYIWGGEKPKDILPPSISCPFLEISSYLELPPCATYIALSLWNYNIQSRDPDTTDPDSLTVNTSFTGTKDEEWFFMVSVAIEARGAKLIPLMLQAIHASNINNAQGVITALNQLSDGLHELGRILERMYEKCKPSAFFHQIRPFLAGSKNMATAGLPNGVFYDQGEGKGKWHQYSGGSNAQSSLIQTFDIFLGVEHSATGETKPNSSSQSQGKTGYIQDMRNYMPGPHRRFLEMLTRLSNVRSYAMSHKSDSSVRDAYNGAIMALGQFRDKHIQLVSRYIIMAARTQPSNHLPGKLNLATATSQMKGLSEKSKKGVCGTGGTDLIPFLKQTRDTTKAAASYAD